ncbi:MAG: rhomboid family intramembrane serine protease [Verrucomicrobiales bacterium]
MSDTLFLVSLGGRQLFAGVSMFVALTAGLGTWIFGQSGLHIGASGVIFGYLGFLVARGLFEKSLRWVLVSIAVGIVYVGLIQSLSELRAGVSWTSHFFGFAGGLGLAMLCYMRVKKKA